MSLTDTAVRRIDTWRGKAHYFVASIALLGILLVGASIMVWQSNRQQQSMALVYTQAQKVLRASHDVKIAIRDARGQERALLLGGGDAHLERYLEGHDALSRSLEHLNAAVQGVTGSDDAVEGLRIAASEYLERVAAAVALAQRGEKAPAIATLRRAGADDGLASIDENVDGIIETASDHSLPRATHSRSVTNVLPRFVYLMSGAGLALLLIAILSAVALRRFRASERIHRDELQKRADTDELTGVANRRQMLTVLDMRIAEARTKGTPLSFAVFDLDDLKSVNQRHGHGVGDRTIRHVVRTAERMLRLNDLIGRLGGDEFGIILPKAARENALTVCERLRKRLREDGMPIGGDKPLYMMISSGIACLTDEDDAASLIERANRALYTAKRDGGDQVRLAA